MSALAAMNGILTDADRLVGEKVTLRLVREDDCGERYLRWLNDPEIDQYLETRWSEQTLDAIRNFVRAMRQNSDSYLFAIVCKQSGEHVGNIKLGPINDNHAYADISFFIGEKAAWGRGLASEAIALVTDFGFMRLNLNSIWAGLYEKNGGSQRVLEKSGYRVMGRFEKKLKTKEGWQDHIWLGRMKG